LPSGTYQYKVDLNEDKATDELARTKKNTVKVNMMHFKVSQDSSDLEGQELPKSYDHAIRTLEIIN
jgi:hypothetical protein